MIGGSSGGEWGGVSGECHRNVEGHLTHEQWFCLSINPTPVSVCLGSPIGRAQALSRPKVVGFVPHNQHVNFQDVR